VFSPIVTSIIASIQGGELLKSTLLHRKDSR
jgi:hypothetical protein